MGKNQTSWQEGQSGNSKGAPKKENSMRAILEEIGNQIHSDDKTSKKKALALRIWIEALKGNIWYVKLLLERMEGMPKQTVEQIMNIPEAKFIMNGKIIVKKEK